ncbi:MAG: O-antigen ligase family protein [Gammaproteobacteria bacterium]|nr:O-antigen ligase family protein [Gammaproteobacteria bacterium]
MQPRLFLSREQIPGSLVTALFALFVVMLPRYNDTAKTWFALLILGATVYLALNWRQLRQTSKLERVFFIEGYFLSDNYNDDVRRGTFGTRVELWKTGWKIFLENPVTGVGVGGFQVTARANSERYQVSKAVGLYKYAHNQYIAALATRGIPGLILFLLLLTLPLYIAMSHHAFDRASEVARLSLMFISLTYLIGCLGEDHFEGKSATMFVAVFVALLLARLSAGDPGQPRESLT